MAKGKFRRNPAQGTDRFSMAPQANIQRSALNRTHGHKTAFDAGYLIPIFCDEALPGDTITLRTTIVGRIATLIYPLMDQLVCDVFFFAVPNRLIWDNWQEFMGEETNPGVSVERFVPIIDDGGAVVKEDSMADYLGIPTQQTGQKYSALPFRAVNLIWNEWFRSQDLQQKAVEHKGDGPDPVADYPLRRRGKRHEYFSSALPFAQKGDPVGLPIGGTAPVTGDIVGAGNPRLTVPGTNIANSMIGTAGGAAPTMTWTTGPNVGDPAGSAQWNNPALALQNAVADLGNTSVVSINQMRELFQIQRLLERDARGGTRYTELIRSHFKVTSPDQRLQRPEWLGGSSNPLQIYQVPSTAEFTQRPVGNLAAYGMFTSVAKGWTKSFTEHCWIIGLASVRANLSYQQGLDRMFSRREKYDFYWPALAHLGEQPVFQKEIYSTGVPAEDDKIFGYQERFAEYRHKPSRVSGAMRSNYPGGSLDPWHLALSFQSAPLLNDVFIEENPPVNRIVAVQDQPQFIVDCHFDYRHVRPMPVYSVPGMIDHF